MVIKAGRIALTTDSISGAPHAKIDDIVTSVDIFADPALVRISLAASDQ
jgi:hypothetical protein